MIKNIIITIMVTLLISCGKNKEQNEIKEIVKFKPYFKNSIGMNFVYVKPGTFEMGKVNEPSFYNEGVVTDTHKVTLTKGFYIQINEVTIGNFKEFINSTNYKTQAEKDPFQRIFLKENGSYIKKKGLNWRNIIKKHDNDNFPVSLISWEDSKEFIKWLNKKSNEHYRLPTEAEWEYACRAGTNSSLYNGNLVDPSISNNPDPNLDKIAWYLNNSDGTKIVKTKKPNDWGLYDMLGNLFEYCEDDLFEFGKSHVYDPIYLSKDRYSKKANRGSAWWYPAFLSTISARDFKSKKYCSNIHGFRVVKDVNLGDFKEEFKGQPIIWEKPNDKNVKTVSEKKKN